MKNLIYLTAMLALASGTLFADIARPEKSPAKTPKPRSVSSVMSQMDIRLDRDAKQARLLIPRSQIQQLRAQLDAMDDDNGDTAAVTTPGVSRTQTIVSGIFLSLAIVFGGMWFVRSGKSATKTGKSLVVFAVVAGIASAATFIYANAGPPQSARSITGKMFTDAVHMYGFGWGEVKLETTNEERIQLIVPDPKDEKPSD
jgi:hypothetical protein